MSLLTEITDYVAAQTGWTVGTDLFAYGFPAEQADTAVVLLPAGGRPEPPAPFGELGDFDVQAICRSREPATAEARALTLQEALQQFRGGSALVVGGAWKVHTILAVQAPYPMGYDSRDRYEFVNHYRVRAES